MPFFYCNNCNCNRVCICRSLQGIGFKYFRSSGRFSFSCFSCFFLCWWLYSVTKQIIRRFAVVGMELIRPLYGRSSEEGLAKGIYIVRITTPRGIAAKKLAVE